jgi:hypothetical protein
MAESKKCMVSPEKEMCEQCNHLLFYSPRQLMSKFAYSLEYNCFANVAVLHNDCLANFFLMNKFSCPIISR